MLPWFQNQKNQLWTPKGKGHTKMSLLSLKITQNTREMAIVKILIAWFAHFSYSPTRATRDIVVEGDQFDELKDVKTI